MSDEQKTEGCELSPELQKLAEEFRAEMEELYESRRRRAAERANMSEEELIADVTARLKPHYLVITLGIDYGVYYYRERPDLFAHYYEKLVCSIQAASPETHVILQSIFPVGRTSRSITNQMVQSANAVIKGIAERRSLVFVNATEVLCDSQGYLREEYCYSEDGIHLTASAYDAILNHLKTYESEIKAQK